MSYFKSKYRASGKSEKLNSVQIGYYTSFCKKFGLFDCEQILEIGSGTGEFASFCNQKNISGIFTDPDVDSFNFMKDRISENIDKSKFYNIDFEAVLDTVVLSKVDAVVAFDVFEHIDFIKLTELLLRLRDKTNRNIRVIARVPNVDCFASAPYWFGDYTHVNALGYFKAVQLANITHANELRTHHEIYPFYHYKYIGLAFAQKILDTLIKTIYRIKGAPSTFQPTANYFIELSYEK